MNINNKHKNIIHYAIIIVIIGYGFSLFRNCNLSNKIEEQNNLISFLTDSVYTFRDKENLLHGKIRTINTENTKTFTKLQIANKEIIELQNLVKEYKNKIKNGSSITTIKTVTKYDTIIKIEHKKDSCDFMYNSQNKWIKTLIIRKGDSLKTGIEFKNDIQVIIGKEKGVWYTESWDRNPYAKKIKVRSYINNPFDKKRFGLGVQTGCGISKNGLFPYVGVGISYNLFKW